jgi:hypothetical protein
MVQMTDRLTQHPIILYLTFVMPMLLLALGIIYKANVFLLILAATSVGLALVLLYLPVESDTAVQ